MAAITGLNHAVLYVRDAKKSADFYSKVFEMEIIHELPGAVFLKCKNTNNDHDLGLFSLGDNATKLPRGASVGLYHLAWQVDTLAGLEQMEKSLIEVGSLIGASDHGATKSLYGQDPNGIDFEVMWMVPEELLEPQDSMKTQHLDLQKEIERFGADTQGRRAN